MTRDYRGEQVMPSIESDGYGSSEERSTRGSLRLERAAARSPDRAGSSGRQTDRARRIRHRCSHWVTEPFTQRRIPATNSRSTESSSILWVIALSHDTLVPPSPTESVDTPKIGFLRDG